MRGYPRHRYLGTNGVSTIKILGNHNTVTWNILKMCLLSCLSVLLATKPVNGSLHWNIELFNYAIHLSILIMHHISSSAQLGKGVTLCLLNQSSRHLQDSQISGFAQLKILVLQLFNTFTWFQIVIQPPALPSSAKNNLPTQYSIFFNRQLRSS